MGAVGVLRQVVSAVVACRFTAVAHCLWQAKEKANRVEEQLQELTSKLASMETEKHSLAARNKVLETALATAKGTPGRVCFLVTTSTDPLLFQLPAAGTYLRFVGQSGRTQGCFGLWPPESLVGK